MTYLNHKYLLANAEEHSCPKILEPKSLDTEIRNSETVQCIFKFLEALVEANTIHRLVHELYYLESIRIGLVSDKDDPLNLTYDIEAAICATKASMKRQFLKTFLENRVPVLRAILENEEVEVEL